MKKLLPVFVIAILMTACNTSPEVKTEAAQAVQQIATADTTGMAAFNAWKAQHELADVSSFQQAQQTPSVPAQKVRTIVKRVPVAAAPKSKPATSTLPSSSNKETNSGSSAGTQNGTMGSESGETAKAEKKEGWSKAAKGAVIGGVTGAAGGAVINKKNRVLGAVIGGVVGAAGGYGIGRTMDKKDGRIDYSTIVN
jgi:hypothetical protein